MDGDRATDDHIVIAVELTRMIDVKQSYLSFSPTPRAPKPLQLNPVKMDLNQYVHHVQKIYQIRTNPSYSLLDPLPLHQQQRRRLTRTVTPLMMVTHWMVIDLQRNQKRRKRKKKKNHTSVDMLFAKRARTLL